MGGLGSSDGTKVEQILVVIKGLLMTHGALLQQRLVEDAVHKVLACTKNSCGLVRALIQKIAQLNCEAEDSL